jgi:hypothetical protein
MDRLNKIISADPKMCESSRNVKHPWVANEAAKTKKDDSYVLKKVRISEKESVEALVPSAKVSKNELRRRRSSQSVSGSTQ